MPRNREERASDGQTNNRLHTLDVNCRSRPKLLLHEPVRHARLRAAGAAAAAVNAFTCEQFIIGNNACNMIFIEPQRKVGEKRREKLIQSALQSNFRVSWRHLRAFHFSFPSTLSLLVQKRPPHTKDPLTFIWSIPLHFVLLFRAVLHSILPLPVSRFLVLRELNFRIFFVRFFRLQFISSNFSRSRPSGPAGSHQLPQFF